MKTIIKVFLNVFDSDERESRALPPTVQFYFFTLLFTGHLILEYFHLSLALMSFGCGSSVFKTVLELITV